MQATTIGSVVPVIEKVFKPTSKQEEFIRIPDSVFEALGGGAAGGGKALDINLDIYTTEGWKTLSDIRDNNTIYDEAGNECKVIKAHDILFNRNCYKLEFDDGSTIIADEDHKWFVYDRRNRENLARNCFGLGWVRSTKTLFDNQRIGTDDRVNFSIQVAKPLLGKNIDLPIDPYTLGIWLGDGNNQSSRITSTDPEVIETISSIYPISTYDYSSIEHKIYGVVQATLSKLDLKHNKHIPRIYFRAKVVDKLELLKGLMDSDGNANHNGTVEFCSTSLKLAKDILELIISLGFKATLTSGIAKIDERVISDRYRIKWTPTIPVFKLSRKLERQKLDSNLSTQGWRYITKISKVESIPVRCLTVDSPSNLYLAGRTLIATHNTDLGIMLPLIRQFTEHPKFKGLVLRRTFPDLEKEIVPRQHEWYGPSGATYNETKKAHTI